MKNFIHKITYFLSFEKDHHRDPQFQVERCHFNHLKNISFIFLSWEPSNVLKSLTQNCSIQGDRECVHFGVEIKLHPIVMFTQNLSIWVTQTTKKFPTRTTHASIELRQARFGKHAFYTYKHNLHSLYAVMQAIVRTGAETSKRSKMRHHFLWMCTLWWVYNAWQDTYYALWLCLHKHAYLQVHTINHVASLYKRHSINTILTYRPSLKGAYTVFFSTSDPCLMSTSAPFCWV